MTTEALTAAQKAGQAFREQVRRQGYTESGAVTAAYGFIRGYEAALKPDEAAREATIQRMAEAIWPVLWPSKMGMREALAKMPRLYAPDAEIVLNVARAAYEAIEAPQ